jgi:acetyl esterase/lipase
MVILPSRVVVPALRLMRANRIFVSADAARRRVRQLEIRPAAYGPPNRLRRDVRVDVSNQDWPVYTITPVGTTPVGSVVYVHGGGWVNQISAQHWHLAAQIAAEANTTVSVPIYPLVPFGTASVVAAGVLALVRENLDRYGATCLAGDSAGGQIALAVALALRDEDGTALPQTVLVSPALDLSWSNPLIPTVQPSDPWLATPGGQVLAGLWRGERDILDPVVSPLMGDLTGLGPITLFSGTRDVLNPDAHLLVGKAADAGVDLTFHEGAGQVHVYPLLPTAVGRDARASIVQALRAGVVTPLPA